MPSIFRPRTFRAALAAAKRKRTLIITDGGGGGGDTPHFASEWRFATGQSDAALRDGIIWDARQGTEGSDASVILAPAGLGLLTRGNIWRMESLGAVNGTVSKDNFVPAATTHWGRWYVRNDLTVDYPFNHPVAYGGLGVPIQFALGLNHLTEFATPTRRIFLNPEFGNAGAGIAYPYQVFSAGSQGVPLYTNFAAGTWFLWEWQVEYQTATTYILRCWLSEVDGNGDITNADIYTNARFFQQDYFGGAGGNLDALQGTTVNFGRSPGADGITGMTRLVVGNESIVTPATNEYCYFASLGISLTGRLHDSDLGLAA